MSNVDERAAIGRDIAEIRALLEKEDFAGAERVWSEGRNSSKGEGELRTLAGFVEGADIGRLVVQALQGNGSAKDLDPAARAQWVDKGMVAALEAKILDEIDTALEKAEAGETDPAEGAPHNVDEAWAFFNASGEGLEATAAKREADFPETEVVAPVLGALRAAQAAAAEGDVAGLEAAREQARGAMNRVFALAVTKYASEGIEDDVARAEGYAFSWGLRGDLPARRLDVVEDAFGPEPGFRKALAVRATLNRSLEDLGLTERLPAFAG